MSGQTPNNESFFMDEPVETINDFGGEDYLAGEESTPEERGDVIVDEAENDENNAGDDGADDAGDSVSDDDAEQEADSEDSAEAGEEADEDSGEEEEESDEDEDEDEDEGEDDKKPIPEKVPRKRLNKEAERRRKAEARVKELEAQMAQRDPAPASQSAEDFNFEVDKDKFQQMQDFLLDGETEKAMAIYQELNKATIDATLQQSDRRFEEKMAIHEQNRELRAAGKDVVASFPELDRNGDDFDEQLSADVVATRDFYMQHRGMTPGDALRRAAKEVANDYGIEDRAAKKETPAKRSATQTKKQKADIKRKVALAEKEQGRLGGQSANNREELPDINSMSDDQFDRLDPRTKAKMRGDIL